MTQAEIASMAFEEETLFASQVSVFIERVCVRAHCEHAVLPLTQVDLFTCEALGVLAVKAAIDESACDSAVVNGQLGMLKDRNFLSFVPLDSPL